MSESLLAAYDVSKEFKRGSRQVPVLRNVNMALNHGEIILLTGASGVGKTTLLTILGGLSRPTHGEILFKNRSLKHFSNMELDAYRNRNIGFVFQFHHLLPEFSALENVAMPLLIRRVDPPEARKKAQELLERVGLSDRLTHNPPELSGGEQQRVALARAIVARPSLVLADEPTGNLDEETANIVFKLMCQLNKELGIAFLVATHNLNLVRSAHRWLKLTEGKVLQQEKTAFKI